MMIVSKSKVFIDTNILYYSINASQKFGQEAIDRINELSEHGNELFISTQIIREYASLTLKNAIYHKLPLKTSLAVVLDNIKTFKQDFHILKEKSEVLDIWIALLPQLTTAKDVYDFNIAATMKSENIKYILTHNVSDFKKFDSWLTVIPLLKNIEK